MPSQRSRTTATARRRCVWHGRDCYWAGGDKDPRVRVGWLMAHLYLLDHPDATDDELRGVAAEHDDQPHPEDKVCRQATERDKQRREGVFAAPTTDVAAVDEAVLRLVKDMESLFTADELAEQQRASDAASVRIGRLKGVA
jgi:hypothetical protein